MENETAENEQVETPALVRKVVILGAAAAGFIIAGGLLHFRVKAAQAEAEADPSVIEDVE